MPYELLSDVLTKFEHAVVTQTHFQVQWETAMSNQDRADAASAMEAYQHWAGIAAGLKLELLNRRSWTWQPD